ncbi:MAG: YggS family pyridoxal phosphate-dependent enzyme [Gammaproteobacteria bacterium]|nr:YggS family pyridoxal phosphate-dependent enzyme [Gammaproteobacteria bacterium]
MNDISLAKRLQTVKQQISAAEQQFGRKTGSVRLLSVSKTRPLEDIITVFEQGQVDFGENYLQDAMGKIEATRHLALNWHFIGPIQSNKTRTLAENFSWVHSLERLKIARRLNDQRPTDLQPLNVCLQVNISREAQKSGVAPEDTLALALEVAQMPRLKLRGLMAIPKACDDFQEQRSLFKALANLYQQLNKKGLNMDTLSMGMSGDIDAAIAEGSTMVRVGSAIFGPRQP